MEPSVRASVADASSWDIPGQYTVVAANILAPVLLANAERIAAAVTRPGGSLLLAGILTTQFDDVAATYGRLGFEERERMTEAEWTSGWFTACG